MSSGAFTSILDGGIIDPPGYNGAPMRYDQSKIDEAVLAVLYLTAWEEHGITRAWKGIDWDATARLFERGLIDDPRNKSKFILSTDEGADRARDAAEKLFAPTASR